VILLHAQLNREWQRMVSYQKEPFLFLFEDRERALYEEIERRFLNDHFYAQRIRFSGSSATGDRSDELLEELRDLVSKMKNEEIRQSCEPIVHRYEAQLTRMTDRREAEERLANIEARIMDARDLIRDHEEVSEDDLRDFADELFVLREAPLFRVDNERVERLMRVLKFISHGVGFNGRDEDAASVPESPQFAAEVLGVSSNASMDDIRLAFKKFVLKNHPDVFPEGSPDRQRAHLHMSEGNQAYTLLRRIAESKK
jgi:hypothetical protein